jgi:predicted enzyme related to lactoylglutathione lyase
MITTTKVGAPCWLDIGSPDIPVTSAFYSKVLGWEFESAGPDMGGYGTFKADGKTVGAVGQLDEEGAKSGWMIYFNTGDADATAQAVEQAGGAVRAEPFDVMDEGRMAQLTDPTGGQFAVWQGAKGEASFLQAVSTPGALTWVELYTADQQAATDFYRTLFGWETSDMPLPEEMPGVYRIVGTGPEPMEDGHGGIMEMETSELRDGKAYWSPVFEVSDCDAAAAQVTEGGGTLLMGPEDMPDVGRVAVCRDPFGAPFSVLTSAPTG